MLKDKKNVRRLALLLCLSLIVGLVPTGILSVPVKVNAVPDASANLIVNGDFEATGEGVPNWKQTAGGSTGSGVVAGKGIDDSNALCLLKKGAEFESDMFAVTSGAALTISFQVVQLEATKGFSATVLWYNEDGSWYDPNGVGNLNNYNDWCTNLGIGTTAEWSQATKTVTVPTGAAKAAVRFYASSSAGDASVIYIDNVTATEVAPTAPPQDAVFAENFNSNNNDAKLSAAGWTANENFSATNHNIGVYSTAYDGCALWMQQTSSAWVQTPAIAAVPGATYKVSVLTNGPDGAANMKLIFVDAAGAVLGESAVELIGTGTAWGEETVTAVAPANTANVYVYFSRNSKDCGIDNLAVYEDLPQATESTDATEEAVVVFTENVEGSDFREKWTLTKTAMPWGDAGYKYEGDRVLLLQSKTDTATSPSFAVTPGKTYTLTYWTKQHTAPQGAADLGSAQIRFLDASGAVIADATAKAPACAVADWTEKTLSADAPAGAVSAQLFFDTEGDKKLIYVVDAISVTESGTALPEASEPQQTESTESTESTEATTPADDNLVVNGGFENGLDSWKNWGSPEIVFDNERQSNVIKLHDPAKDTVSEIQSGMISVIPGAVYNFSLWYKQDAAAVETATGDLPISIQWFDADGVRIDPDGDGPDNGKDYYTRVPAPNNTSWTKAEAAITVPAGAVQAWVQLAFSRGAINTVYVDDITLVKAQDQEPEGTEPADGLVVNGGFEDGINGWGSHSDAITSNTDDKHSGNASALFVDDTTAGATYITQKVPVVAGKTYTISAWVKILEGKGGYIGLYGLDDANDATTFKQESGWIKYSVTVTIPEGKDTVTVEFGTNSGQVVTYLIDDIELVEGDGTPDSTESTEGTEGTESTEATEPAGDKIFADEFEAFDTVDRGNGKTNAVPTGWTSYDPTNIRIAANKNYFDVYSGYNLFLQEKGAKWIKSPAFDVVEGYNYTVSFMDRKYSTQAGEGGYAAIVFVDAEGNILKSVTADAGVSKDWTALYILAKAPEGAVKAYVEFGMTSASSGEPTYAVDNVAVYEVESTLDEEEPTLPTEATVPVDPMKPFEEDFETPMDSADLNAGPADWNSNDDNGNVYGTMIGLVNNSLSVDGNYLRLQKIGTWIAKGPAFPVEIGYEYTAKFMARKLADNKNFNGYVEIVFTNTRGKIVETHRVVAGKTYNAWAEESISAVAPIGAYYAYIVIGVENIERRTDADFAVDNLVVTRAEAASFEYDEENNAPIVYVPVVNEDFSNAFTPEGAAKTCHIPVGWTASVNSAAMGVASYDKYDGTTNLCIQNKGEKWIQSPTYEAKEGYGYLVSYVEKKLNGHIEATGGFMKVVFVDADGNVLKEYKEAVGNSAKWTDFEYEYQAPAKTAGMYIVFGISADATGGDPTYSIDNLSIGQSENVLPDAPEKDDPEDNTPGTPSTPSDPDSNAPTSDNTMIAAVSTVLVVALALAVLVIKKRRFF